VLDLHHCDNVPDINNLKEERFTLGSWFQFMVSWLHCFWAVVRQKSWWNKVATSWRPGSRERNKEEVAGHKIHLSQACPLLTYFLQVGQSPAFHLLPMLPSYYESIKGLIY
jgi:hypothetical protein